ncbi:MAG: alpha/beta hydrolase-fold protein [Planctomycetota bacterium]
MRMTAQVFAMLAPLILAPALFSQDKSAAGKGVPTKKSKEAKPDPPPFAWVNPPGGKAHPRLQHSTFFSELANSKVGYGIVLPLNYDQSDVRFPVVYHLHGGRPGSESKAISIVGPIADAAEAEMLDSMIHVFVNGGPVSHYNVPDQKGAIGADVFIRELIPHIDDTYRTIADRAGRGLTGFSQGGRGTMRLSLRYPDLFACAAAGGGGYEAEKRISQSDGYENPTLRFADGDNAWDLARVYAASDAPRVTHLIYVGTKGFNYANNLDYMTFLTDLGIEHSKLIVDDVPHSNRQIYDRHASDLLRFFARHLGGN